MKLFDDYERTDLDPSGFSEPNFTYLNRSARTGFTYVRELIEEWFVSYKASQEKQEKLRREFRSMKDDIHLSSFFEIYLYNLFAKLGYSIEVEPEWIGGTKPDFLLEDAKGYKILLEATAIYPESEFGNKKKFENLVIDNINKYVKNPNFSLEVKVWDAPTDNPPFAKIARYLDIELRKLDVDIVEQLIKNSANPDFDILPRITYPHDSWNIEFVVLPMKKESRGNLNRRAVGIVSHDFMFIDDTEPIIRIIQRKYGRYGDLNIPYILAVNHFSPFVEDIDVEDALIQLWKGGQQTRVSGLLVFERLYPESINMPNPTLWHHPYAQYPINLDTFPIRQKIYDANQKRYMDVAGIDASQLLMLDKTKFTR